MKSWYWGTLIILVFAIFAVFAPWLSPYDPNHLDLVRRLEPPSPDHWLGLDENGADVLSKIIFGARVSLGVAWTTVLLSAFIGLIVGSVSAWFGGWFDQGIMRIIDMIYAFPGFLLALALVGALGPSVFNLVLALCLTSWTGFARLVRGEVLHLKNREYVQAARALGASNPRLIVLHVWPNLLSLLVVQMTFAMSATIIAEAGLSFLGLGVPPSTPTWGSLLNSGRRVLSDAPIVSFAPGLAIVVLVLSFNLLGDALRDRLDPRRGRASV